MKFVSKTLSAAVVATTASLALLAPTANADVGATVGVASTYLWRGFDLGSGTPAVSGDLKFSESGFYTGIWGSSGDTATGSEYDLYAGYGGAVGLFKYDFSLWNYNYPTGPNEFDFADVSDAVLGFGVGPVMFNAYIPVAGPSSPGDYMYYTLGGTFGSFSVLLGMHSKAPIATGFCASDEEVECSPVHINFTYAYNSNLSFTLSQFVADQKDEDDLKFVVSYSLPIDTK